MMKKIIFALLAAAVLFFMCSCVSTADLVFETVDEEGNPVTSQVAVQSNEGLQIMVAVDQYAEPQMDMLMSFASADGSDHFITEGNIQLYGGNKDTGDWSMVDIWDSHYYMNELRRQNEATLFAFGILGTFAILDAVLDPGDRVFTFDYDYPYGYRYGRHRNSWRVISRDPLLNLTLTSLSVIETGIALDQLSEMCETDAGSTMLTSGIASKGATVSGGVHFTNVPVYPDYKLVYRDGSSDNEFVFSRTDRDSIINPWADRSTGQLLMAYSYSFFGAGRHNFSLAYLSPRFLGVYAGTSIYNDDRIGGDLGFTFKVASYTWLKAGFEVHNGQTDDEKIGFSTIIDATFDINHMAFTAGMVYDHDANQWQLETGFGFSF